MDQTGQTGQTDQNELQRLLEQLDTVPSHIKWTLEESRCLLEHYLNICKRETQIFELIYNHHGCDSYEDIFRDYNRINQKDKIVGIEYAIQGINDAIMWRDKEKAAAKAAMADEHDSGDDDEVDPTVLFKTGL